MEDLKPIRKRVYAIAAGMDMVERNNKDDPFHQLIYGITEKISVSELTKSELFAVERELRERMKLKNHTKPLKKKSDKSKPAPGMMTEAQQHLVWRLIYRLCELEPTDARPVDRLIGAINKNLRISASEKNPFYWIKFEDGKKLIEQLKRYVRSAERRATKKAGDG